LEKCFQTDGDDTLRIIRCTDFFFPLETSLQTQQITSKRLTSSLLISLKNSKILSTDVGNTIAGPTDSISVNTPDESDMRAGYP